MKTAPAGLALISGLMAVVMADSLPPEDIPLQCVAICGPIVELTTDCNVHMRRLKKRRPEDVARREWVPKLAVEPPQASVPRGKRVEVVDKFGKRSFSIIVAAPTSFPVEDTTSSVLDLRVTSSITRINPTFDQSTSTAALPKSTKSTTKSTSRSTTSTSIATSTITPPASKSIADQADSTTTSSWDWEGNLQEPQGQLYSQNNAEEDCVCLNESFDVAKVTALCASCIALAGFPENNIDVIMEGCNFTELTYTPSLDSVANNIRVEAVLPSTVASANGGLILRPAGFGLAVAALGFVFALL
ncbi:hypothetical protein G7Z17_g10910 [Cylindrodendrum hubeiense]|uniref:Uncharacterized protein n=1 Tax=Cylindrodendrum hubeiense TaxID=595255 RepID=A0A9P5GYL2_9HYPO|nr:hypothetical protein G7Z17_g10910 [Cylindrodendrum hubeiense]